MTVIASMHAPSGNLVELHEEGGRFFTTSYERHETVELDRARALEWWKMVRSCGGRAMARFPFEEAQA